MNKTLSAFISNFQIFLYLSLFTFCFNLCDLSASTFRVPDQFQDIQTAIDAAVDGDTILVAPGSYEGSGNIGLRFFGKEIVLKSELGSSSTEIFAKGQDKAFYFIDSETNSTIVQGFTLRFCQDISEGGAVSCIMSSPVIRECKFVNNNCEEGGGAVYSSGGAPEFSNCIFEDNTSGTDGGGVFLFNSNASFTDCIFRDNGVASTGGRGGALFSHFSNPIISDCDFENNWSLEDGGAIYALSSAPVITATVFTQNIADDEGGAIYYDLSNGTMTSTSFISNDAEFGGGAFYLFASNPVVTGGLYSGNESPSGAALYINNNSVATFNNIDVRDNDASNSGGAVYCINDSKPEFVNCQFLENSAVGNGGAFFCSFTANPVLTDCLFQSNSARRGGVFDLFLNSSPVLTNCQLIRNSASTNGGAINARANCFPQIINCTIFAQQSPSASVVDIANGASPTINNTIIAYCNGDAPIRCDESSTPPAVSCTNIYGNEGGDWVDCLQSQAGIDGNLSANPFFCDTLLADFSLGSISPCLPEKNSCEMLIGALPQGCLMDENQLPEITGIPDQIIEADSYFVDIMLDEYVNDPDHFDEELSWTITGNQVIIVTISPERVVSFGLLDTLWLGTEVLIFEVTDPEDMTDIDTVYFTRNPVNLPPVISNIPGQTIDEGDSFVVITLDDYVTDPNNEDAELIWMVSGDNNGLDVTIDQNRIARINAEDSDYFGTGFFTFTVSDPGGLSDFNEAIFIVNPINDPPIVSAISDQLLEYGSEFELFDLDTLVEDVDNSDEEIIWTYFGNNELVVSISGGRELNIQKPDEDWFGSEMITFIATDPEGLADSTSATYTIEDQPPILEVDPLSITFAAAIGEDNPQSQTLEIMNTGGSVLDWQAVKKSDWLILDNTAGIGNGIINLSVNVPSQDTGSYFDTITISAIDALDSPQMIEVALVVSFRPEITVQPVSQEITEGELAIVIITSAHPIPTVTPGISIDLNTAPEDNWMFIDNGENIEFGFEPDSTQAGEYDINFIATVGLLSDTATAKIVVNDRPYLTITGQTGSEDTLEINASLELRFNHSLDKSTIDQNSFKIIVGDSVVTGSIEFLNNDESILFTPENYFPPLDQVSIEMSEVVKGVNGESWWRSAPANLYFKTGVGIFPGDLNNDGVVNLDDIDPLANNFRITGLARNSTENWREWQIQQADSWQTLETTFADADGDGVIDERDLFAIGRHWELTHPYGGRHVSIELHSDRNLDGYKALYEAVKDIDSPFMSKVKEHLASKLFETEILPEEFYLAQNYPNPFNPTTSFDLKLPSAQQVRISIHNLIGQEVRVLHNGYLSAGEHTFSWYGKDENENSVSSGVYLYKVVSEQYNATRKMLLLK